MTRSYQRLLSAAFLTCLCVIPGCRQDELPTEVDVEKATPVVPGTPAPGPVPPPAPAPAPAGDNRRSFVWTEETGFTILKNPPGVILVSAQGINDNGEVAGTVIMDQSAGAPIYRGFKWSAAKGFTFIIGPASVKTHVTGIDEQRTVGYLEFGGQRAVFVWSEAEGLRDLGIPLPYLNVLGIRSGVVFGNVSGSGTAHAFRLHLAGGSLEALPTASEAGGGVMGINDKDESVGYDGNINYGFGGSSDAVIWDPAGNRSVAYDCRGEDDCFAYLSAINSAGTAVGLVTEGELGDTRVFKWSRSRGVEYLNVPEARRGKGVAGINEEGSILAHNGQDGFIFKPSGTVTVIRAPYAHSFVQPRAMNRHGHVVGMLF